VALSRIKVWIAGEVLTASDLNGEINNILNNAYSLISPLTGAIDLDGFALTVDAAGVSTLTSSTATGLSYVVGAKTGTPGTTGSIANFTAQTFTDNATANSGTASTYAGFTIQRPTLAATNTSVVTTDAATLYIPNAPAAGTNETITNAYALWVDDGIVRLDGALLANSGLTVTGVLSATSLGIIDAAGDLIVGTAADTAARLAIGAARQVLQVNAGATAPAWSAAITLASEQASTSGTSIDFTGIPAGVRRITIMLAGVSLSATAELLFQLGDSGGIEATGYLGTGGGIASATAASANYTTGFGVTAAVNTFTYNGSFTLSLEDASDFTWVMSGSAGSGAGVFWFFTAGMKSLSAMLDRVRITTIAGTATFDAGVINISFE